MSLSSRIIYLFLSFIVLDEATSMKGQVPYGDKVLWQNKDEDFFEDLQRIHNIDSGCLERASWLLGAGGAKKQQGKLCDYAIARKIDVLVGGKRWQDESDVTNRIMEMEDHSLENIVQSFINDNSEPSEMVQVEIERAFLHLRKHDIASSHVIRNVADRKTGKSFFFFLKLDSAGVKNDEDDFFKTLWNRLSNTFSKADLSSQKSDISRSCVQVEYKISGLFDEPFYVSGIPIYSCDNFRFIPISGGYIAKSIVLRFTIQKLGTVRRLYLMTLFPDEQDNRLLVSDNKLRALSSLNEVDSASLFKPQPLPLQQSVCITIVNVSPPVILPPVILQQSQIDYFYVDAPASRNLVISDNIVIFEKNSENSWGCLLL